MYHKEKKKCYPLCFYFLLQVTFQVVINLFILNGSLYEISVYS